MCSIDTYLKNLLIRPSLYKLHYYVKYKFDVIIDIN